MKKKEWVFTNDLEDRRTYLVEVGYKCYCLQTMGGNEISLAEEVNITHKEALALPFLRITHKSIMGIKSTYQKVLLPGYVFLFLLYLTYYLFLHFNLYFFMYFSAFSRFILTNMDDGSFALSGGDKVYAEWVFNNGGIIGMSKAIRINKTVKIISGPLFNMVGKIKEYSKKNRNCRIEITLFNRLISMWLPFQWVTEAPEMEEEAKKEEEKRDNIDYSEVFVKSDD